MCLNICCKKTPFVTYQFNNAFNMKDRIRLIMERENLTPAKFADMLNINRAVISHILNGRNNPSLDVVTKILGDMDYINPEWLINGRGNMYKNGIDPESLPKEPDLFNQREVFSVESKAKAEKQEESELKNQEISHQNADFKSFETSNRPDKKITQIIIYYNDNTFERFNPY